MKNKTKNQKSATNDLRQLATGLLNQQTQPVQHEQPVKPTISVLLVEGPTVSPFNVSHQLQQLGYRCTRVQSGTTALAVISEISPDLVITDTALEGTMDGITLAQQIRSPYNLPFIYLTTDTTESTLARAKTTVPMGYLLLPVASNELATTIEIALQKHQSDNQISKLNEELQIHQIELELQNEQLREAQIELEVSRNKYFDLYDLDPSGYMTLSHDGLIQEINFAGTVLLGQCEARLTLKARQAMGKHYLNGVKFTQFICSEY